MHKTQMLGLEEVIPKLTYILYAKGGPSLGRIPPLLQTPAYSDTSWAIRTPPPKWDGINLLRQSI